VKLKVVKKGTKETQALPCVPDHVTPVNHIEYHEREEPISLTKEDQQEDQRPDPITTTSTQEEQDEEESEEHFGSRPTEKTVSCRVSMVSGIWANAMMKSLNNLNEHQKFCKTAVRARRRYFSNAMLACRLAFWMVVVGSPVMVYPVAEFFNNWGTRSSKYMASYGMAMTNFCFLLGPSLGASTRYAIEGVIGTLLPLANVLLLNQAFGSYMKGGAFTSRDAVPDVVLDKEIYRSSWLPLCNLGNGDRFVMTNSTAEFLQECFINIHWSSLTDESIRAAIIFADLAIFISVFLAAGFGSCVRVYALTYLLYWAMLFVSPTSEAFNSDPSDPWTQSIMTCVGGVVAVFSQLLPCPNTAHSKAAKLLAELSETVAAVVEALPYATKAEVNMSIESAIEGTSLWISDIGDHLASAWFEDFNLLSSRSRRRKRMESQTELLAALLQHASMATRLAAQLTQEDAEQMADSFPSLQFLCASAAQAIPKPGEFISPDAEDEYDTAMADMQAEFPKAIAQQKLSGSTLSFTLALCTISTGTVSRLKALSVHVYSTTWNPFKLLSELSVRMELPQTRKYPSHPLFVFRSTLAMVLAFLFGWVGLERVMRAYSYGAAVTIAIVVANTTGAGFSLGLIMNRLNSAVIGTVLGQCIGQVLAVKTYFHASLFGLWLFGYSFFLIFQILHSPAHAGVALPTLAIGVGLLVPPTGVFREYNSSIDISAEVTLAASVKETVLGGTIMLFIDLCLFSSARGLVQHALKKSVKCSIGLLSRVMAPNDSQKGDWNADGSSNEEADVLVHLDEMKRLLPHAANEPAPRGIEFPSELFVSIERSLRTMVSELGTLEWLFDMIAASSESKSSVLSGQRDFTTMLTEVENFFTKELQNIQIMLKDLYKRRLRAASSIALSSKSTVAATLRQQIIERGTDEIRLSTTPKGANAQSFTRRLSSLVETAGDRKRAFQELVEKMRSAAQTSRGETPLSDLLSQVELVLVALHTCSASVKTIETALAQYG